MGQRGKLLTKDEARRIAANAAKLPFDAAPRASPSLCRCKIS